MRNILKMIEQADRVVLLTHKSPDGDALGSVLALAEAIEAKGKPAVSVCDDSVPELYAFLPRCETLVRPEDVALSAGDFVLTVDVASMTLLGKSLQLLKAAQSSGCIDHHMSNQGIAQHNFIDTSAGATGEIVLTLIEKMGVALTTSIAVNLYTAIVTDTGRFSYNTMPRTMCAAARLLPLIDLRDVIKQLYGQRTLAKTRLIGEALRTLDVEDALAVMSVSKARMEAAGAVDSDAEGVVDFAKTMKGIEVAVFLRENGEDIKVSLRSNEVVNVNALAARFGGGGHIRASGATMRMSMEEALPLVKAAALEMIRQARESGWTPS